MTVTTVATAVRRRRSRPELPGRVVFAGAVVGWLGVLAMSLPRVGGLAHRHDMGAVADAAAGAPADALSWGWALGWLLMTAAMMWPLLVPVVDRVSRAVLPRWRARLTAVTVLVVTGLWFALGLAAATVAQVAGIPSGSLVWQLVFLGVAAIAWGSARRSRLLWRCAKLPPIAPSGMRGVRSAARVGLVSWERCALLCGPLMIAMAVGHSVVVMIAASISVWWEAWHPRARRDRVPLALIVVAALGAIAGEVLAS